MYNSPCLTLFIAPETTMLPPVILLGFTLTSIVWLPADKVCIVDTAHVSLVKALFIAFGLTEFILENPPEGKRAPSIKMAISTVAVFELLLEVPTPPVVVMKTEQFEGTEIVCDKFGISV